MTAPRGGAGVEQAGRFERLVLAFRHLPRERRLAVLAALGLFLTLFLPWYQETVIANGTTALRSASASLTGWGAFSWVEAAVLLVAAGVLVLLFVRAEGAAFHVPWGDGGVIMGAGLWVCALILWRMFDKEGTTGHGLYTTTSGIEWGIFVALAVAAALAYAGSRIRLAHEPEPPLPGDRRPPRRGPDMQADENWIHGPAPVPAGEAPTVSDTRPRRRRGGPATANDQPRASRPLDRRDIEDLDIAEPPTGRFDSRSDPLQPTQRIDDSAPATQRVRHAEPATQRVGDTEPPTEPTDDPEDQLTLRLPRSD